MLPACTEVLLLTLQGKAHLLQGRDVLSAVIRLKQVKAYVVHLSCCVELSDPADRDSACVERWDDWSYWVGLGRPVSVPHTTAIPHLE